METLKPFVHDIKKVKAILLGPDPGNKTPAIKTGQLQYVFGINGNEKSNFQAIERNLHAIGLTRNDIYAQNLVKDRLPKATEDFDKWVHLAWKWLPVLEEELDSFDPDRRIPVLVTSERIIYFLSLEPLPTARETYLAADDGMVKSDENWLGRLLIPFYRHHYYSLEKSEYKQYRDTLRRLF